MAESILFLTGHLARARLEAVLHAMTASFDWKVLDIGVKVAALMTEDIIMRRLPSPIAADKVMLPGRCRADIDRLGERFGVPFLRGPDELRTSRSLASAGRESLRRRANTTSGSSPRSSMPLRLPSRRSRTRALLCWAGADVIDLGCLPDTPFPISEGGRGAEGGLQGQRGFGRRERGFGGAARRARFPPQPQRIHARHRR
jgi:hypothetical protein